MATIRWSHLGPSVHLATVHLPLHGGQWPRLCAGCVRACRASLMPVTGKQSKCTVDWRRQQCAHFRRFRADGTFVLYRRLAHPVNWTGRFIVLISFSICFTNGQRASDLCMYSACSDCALVDLIGQMLSRHSTRVDISLTHYAVSSSLSSHY